MPPGSRYGMCLQEVKLRSPGDPLPPPNPLHTADNVAGKAVVTASSVCPGYQARAAVNGYVGGFPAEKDYEWASQGERDTAMLRLTWAEPQRIDRIWLFDRPSPIDRITSAMLVFSDGTTIPVGAVAQGRREGDRSEVRGEDGQMAGAVHHRRQSDDAECRPIGDCRFRAAK